MPITYIGSGTARVNTTATNPCVVAYPVSAELGGSPLQADDAIVLIVTSASLTIPTNPSGSSFTAGISDSSGGSSPSYLITVRRATGSESGSVSVTVASTQNQGQMHVFRGVDWTTNFDVASVAGGAGSFRSNTTVPGGAYTMGSLTTTKAGVALIYGGAYNFNTVSWTPPTVPAAFTELRDTNASSPGTTHGYLIWSGSGATGGINLVLVGSTVRGAAGCIALRPITAATIDADVDLTAVATLTTGAYVEEFAAVAMTAVSTLTTAGVVTEVAAVAMTASSTLTVAATTVVTQTATVALSSSSTLTTGAVVTELAAVAMTATSTLTAAAVRQPEAAVSLVAGSALTTAAVVSRVTTVALTAGSTLTTAAVRQPEAAVSLVATSTLTTAAVRERPAAVALTTTSTLTVAATTSGAPVISGAVALVSSSTLSATAIRQPEAAVSLVAGSTLSVTAVRERPAAVALITSSTLTAAGFEVAVSAVALSATSTLTTAATVTPAVFGAVSLVASSTLTVAAVVTPAVFGAVALVSTSTLTVAAVVTGFPYTETFPGASGSWPVPWETVDTSGGLAEARLSGEGRGYLGSLTGAHAPVTVLLNHHPLADQEVACEVTMGDATDDYSIVLRADTAISTGVRLTVTRRTATWGYAVEVGTLASPTVLDSDTAFLINPSIDTLKLRYQVVGTNVRARLWDPAGAEPVPWTSESTQSAVSAAGYVGVSGNGAN